MIDAPTNAPARSYDEAMLRARALQTHDDALVLPQAHTQLLDCGKRTNHAVVLLHGFTNHPGQYAAFAPLVHARGANVLAPRLPGNGDRDRLSTRLLNVTAEETLAVANEAVDIACGLGERVTVLGISTSGLLSAYFAHSRGELARCVIVSPAFAMLDLPYGISRFAALLMRTLPNVFVWWDPRNKMAQRPVDAYPRFPTRALGQALRIGNAVHDRSKRELRSVVDVTTVVNRADPAVNNHVTAAIAQNWRDRGPDGVDYHEFTDLPENHDIIDPDNPLARTEIVYPVLLDALTV